MAMLAKREAPYERSMRADVLAAWPESLSAQILASPMNKSKERSRKKRKSCGAWMWCSLRMKMRLCERIPTAAAMQSFVCCSIVDEDMKQLCRV